MGPYQVQHYDQPHMEPDLGQARGNSPPLALANEAHPWANAKLTMYPTYLPDEEELEYEQLDNISRATRDLVNVEDIKSPPRRKKQPEPSLPPTTQRYGSNVVLDKHGRIVRSKGLAPNGGHWSAGTNASLDRMRSAGERNMATDVMRPPPPSAFHPGAVHAGAMVSYGSPLDAPSGFGAGQYYSAQRAAAAASYYPPQPQQPMQYPQHPHHSFGQVGYTY